MKKIRENVTLRSFTRYFFRQTCEKSRENVMLHIREIFSILMKNLGKT